MNKKISVIVYLIGIIYLILGVISLIYLITYFSSYLGMVQRNITYLYVLVPWNLIVGILVIVLGRLLSKEA